MFRKTKGSHFNDIYDFFYGNSVVLYVNYNN